MQISRLFGIVYILLNRQHTNATARAERFEVSVRTIYRDIDVLSQAGVPIYSMQGTGGGIFIDVAYVLNKAVLSDDDQAAILLALQSLTINLQCRQRPVAGPPGQSFQKESANWVEVDFSRWGGTRDRETLSLVKDAILQQRMLSFAYFSGNGEYSERSVYPMRLLFKSRAWYMQAFCLTREAHRTFKLVRMADVRLHPDTFLRKNLPALSCIEETADAPPQCLPIMLRFSRDIAWRVLDEFDPQTVQRNEDGTLTVRCYFPMDAWLYGYILSFGKGCEVVSPSALRASMRSTLQKLRKNTNNLTYSCQVSAGILSLSKDRRHIMENHICQSCGMPMEPAEYGTNQDGSPNDTYCKYCFADGAFTSDEPFDQMVETCVPFMATPESGMTADEARTHLRTTMKNLKRWQ